MQVDAKTRRRLNDIADEVRERGDTEIAMWLLVLAGELEHVGWNDKGEPTFMLKEDAI